MAATNANDGKKAVDNRGSKYDNHKNGTSQKSGRTTNYTSKEQGVNKPYNRENRPFRKEQEESNSNKPIAKGHTPLQKDTKYGEKLTNRDKKPNAYNKVTRSSGYNKVAKSAGYNGYNKDNDEEMNSNNHSRGKGQRTNDSRIKVGQKDKEKQPDKIETIKRLEKEKKVLDRKNHELEQKQDKKVQKVKVKQRRTTTIDWTKGYANGLYGDDDEDYTEFM